MGDRGARLATPTGVPLEVSDDLLRSFLAEDLGDPPRDVTTDPLIGPEVKGRARLVAREGLVVSGLDEAVRIFRLSGAEASAQAQDGASVDAGAVLLTVRGSARAILRAERTALNLVGRMSGIATLTRRVQARIAAVNPSCRVAATRKTTPGFRVFEKRAVLHGGGDPHRFGLFDQVLLKDNHLAAAGDLETAIRIVRDAGEGILLEVEVETMGEAEAAARAQVDLILVDNRSPEDFQAIAARIRALSPQTRIEASGGITPDDAPEYAPSADRISLGALTQRAPAVDVGLDWDA